MGGPPKWYHWNGGGAPGRRHAVIIVIKAMMAQLRPQVLLALPGSHGHAASRVPWPSVLWAATGWWLMWRGGHWADGGPLYDGSRREPS